MLRTRAFKVKEKRSLIPACLRTAAVLFIFLFALDRFWKCNPYICHQSQPPLELDPDLPTYTEYHSRLRTYPPKRQSNAAPDRAIVLASVSSENTSWVHHHFPDWQRFVYRVDDPLAEHFVPANKGHESMAYLTYIIDHYHHLPSLIIFHHAQRYQWHNDDPSWDAVTVIRNLRPSYVQMHGYANLRCTWSLGCPVSIVPRRTSSWLSAMIWPADPVTNTEAAFAQAWLELFPDKTAADLPSAIATPCCAQFALSRDAVQALPLERWRFIRAWLLATKLSNDISGRVMEYTWHQLMGKPAEYCPSVGQCFCDKFGLCDLDCPGPDACRGRYKQPGVWQFPKGWPDGEATWWGWPDAQWAERESRAGRWAHRW